VFVGSECDSVTDAFRQRLKSEFETAGLCFEDYVKILPRLPYTRFIQLLNVLDINLDTFGWNGGITTMNSLAANCPVVTMPGEFMRGRHSYAILKMIGVEELITQSVEEYISLSVRIGLDAEFRASTVQKIKDQKHRLFNDQKCVDYLDEFLKSKVAEVRANSTIPEEVKTIELTHATGTVPFYFRGSSSDEIVVQQIFVDHDYSLSDLQLSSQLDEFLSANIGRGLRPLILDMGANIGASAVWFLHNYPLSRVIAVEPDEGNFELLTRNTQGLDCIAVKGAIASAKGFANIEDPGLCHFGLRTAISPGGSVETFTVPELMQRYGGNSWFPFIAKIDIEGAESELFSKNTDWIDQFPVVIIELHDWLLPNENSSRNFLQCVSSRARDFLYKRENIFSVRTPVLGSPTDNPIYQPVAPLAVP
jgi:FkbM family methyltransferase